MKLLREYIGELLKEVDLGDKVWAKDAPSSSRHAGEEENTSIEDDMQLKLMFWLERGDATSFPSDAIQQATQDARYNDIFQYSTEGLMYRGMRIDHWNVSELTGLSESDWRSTISADTFSRKRKGVNKLMTGLIPTSFVYNPPTRSGLLSSWTPNRVEAEKFASRVRDPKSNAEMGIILVAQASSGKFLNLEPIYKYKGMDEYKHEKERISIGPVPVEGVYLIQPSKPRNWI